MSGRADSSRTAGRGLELPELNVAIFAFLLNFVWEFWQAPLYRGMRAAPHWAGVETCTIATLGDVLIALLAFWFIAAIVHSRGWVLEPSVSTVLGFTATGIAVTVGAEWLFTDALDRWAYSASMPRIPVLGTGLAPVLQWLVLPPLVVWFVRRQLT